MKKTAFTFQNVSAAMLTGIYAGFWLFLSFHFWVSPDHHHHEKKVCRHAPNEKHIHGEEYAADDCSICQIATAQAEPPEPVLPVFSFSEVFSPNAIFGESACLSAEPNNLFQPRAPPALHS